MVLLMVVCLLVLGFGENSKAKEVIIGRERVSCGITDLLGMQVKNPAGEVLGSISNFVFDWKGGSPFLRSSIKAPMTTLISQGMWRFPSGPCPSWRLTRAR